VKTSAVVGLLLIVVGVSHAQAKPKPEDGFVSSENYTNAFFGFSVPFPRNVQLTLLSESRGARDPYRHVLFGAMSHSPGHAEFLILADEIASSGITDPREALRALGAREITNVTLGGKSFATGRSKSGPIYFVYYATAVKGYILYLSVFGYHRKVLKIFQHSIEEIKFFDPATAKQWAGPDSRAYHGPPRG
jgi:hypothetical protein